MMTRTHRKLMTFAQPFLLRAIDGALPPGTYKIDTDEELIDGLSFLALSPHRNLDPSSIDRHEKRV